MSVLGIIEKLLDGFEVEWKKFDDVGVFLRGKRFVKADMKSEGVPCIHYGEMYTHFGVHAKEAKSFLDESVASKLRVANPGDVVIVAAGETIEDIGNGTAWLGESDIVFHDACFSFKSSLDPKYVSYYLRTNLFKEQIRRSVSSGKISSINAKGLGKATIPIPCPDNPEKSLAIQAEIVRILDAFTAMTAELTAELNMRKKQYNYYRDQLLSFDLSADQAGEGEVEWKTLGDLAENLDSKRKPITSGLREAGEIPYYGASGIVDYVKDYIFDGDYLLVSEDGANLLARNTPIAFSISGKTWVNNHAHVLKFETYAERKYVEYYLNSIDLTPYISGAAQPKLNKKNLGSIKIPNPAPKEKERIVAILDKFDSLTCSIKEGLPREIELRQKQYEYYRDLLLSFPKSDEAA
ncbi:MAG TPA: restriction endonuclease [Pseudoalteromonas sp.]|nr:restriction endonuclease [Pseudoalteromonas sp.]|tara:strand:+ start:2599 stop:3822 length:1224 start_codon:yes stop_codon:yes gene_type:complete